MKNKKEKSDKKSTFITYLQTQLKLSLTHVFFYLALLCVIFFSNINYFFKQQFFTGNGTSDLLLFFSVIPYICIIIIPALCYKKNEALYDDFVPLSNIKKIIARYLEVLILFGIILLFLIPTCIIVNCFGSVDFGQVFASLFCLILYGSAVISLCLFINELFNSKITGIIVSAILLGIFHTAHLVSIYIVSNNFISNICKKISFAWHFDAASKGIIDTRDILFFIIISLLFLFFNYLLKNKKMGKQYKKTDIVCNIGYILVLILVLLNSTRYYKRLDISKNKTFTLSKYTTQIIERIEEPVKITYYRSSSLSRLYPQVRDVTDYLSIYASKNKKVSFLVKDPDKDSSIGENLLEYGINSQQMRNIKNNSTEYINVYSAIVIETKGNIDTIPFILSAETLEYDLDVRITHLLSDKRRIVNLILGNGYSFYEDYDFVVPWLNSQGFVCNLIYPEDPSFAYQLENTEGPLVVIGDSEIYIEQAMAIENYILSGKGNAFFAVSPYSVDIQNDWSITQNQRTNVVEILENWGIIFLPEIAADISCSRITLYSQDESQDPFTQQDTHTQIINYPLWINVLPQLNTNSGMTLFWPVPLQVSETVRPYIISTPAAYSYEVDLQSPQRLIESNPFMLEQADTSGLKRETKILGAEILGQITGLFNYNENSNAHIIAISDPLFINSLMIGYNGGDYGDYRNFDFLTNSILKLNGEEELAKLQNFSKKDKSLYKITDQISFIRMQIITYLILFILIPLIIIIIGILLVVLKNVSTGKKIEKVMEDEK